MTHPMPLCKQMLDECREVFTEAEIVWAEEKGKVYGIKGDEGVVPVLGQKPGVGNLTAGPAVKKRKK